MALPFGYDPHYFTEAMLQTITEAVGTGTKSVYYGDKRVEYRSLDEMIRIRNMVLVALGYANPQGGRSFAEFNKGLHRDCGNGLEGDVYGDDSGWNSWH